MKKSFTLLVSLLMIACTFSSCKKDSDQPENELKIETTSYPMDKMALFHYFTVPNGEIFYITLCSPGITIDNGGNLTNAGNFIEFVVITTSADGVASGTYPFTPMGEDSSPSMSFTANSFFCLNWVSGASNMVIDIESGTLKITRKGSEYTLSYTGGDADGNTISAYYKGTGDFYELK